MLSNLRTANCIASGLWKYYSNL